MTTQRGEDPARGLPEDEAWFARPRQAPDDAPQPLPAAPEPPQPLPAAPGATRAERRRAQEAPGATRAERRRAQEAAEAAAGRPFTGAFTESPSGTGWPRPTPPAGPARPDPGPAQLDRPATTDHDPADPFRPGPPAAADRGPAGRRRSPPVAAGGEPGDLGRPYPGPGGVVPGPRRQVDEMNASGGSGMRQGDGMRGAFDPGDTGTWRVRDVVPGADGGRRTTTILRYLVGLLAIDHVRALGRWAFPLPVIGLLLLLVRPRWIGLAVIVLGILLIVARVVAVRLISHRTLPRRYRPVEDELRAAVEAGKANLRGELRRVGMPNSAMALPRSAVRLGSSDSRRTARTRLRDIEIDRVLPRAQLDRALRVLDEAPTSR